MNIKWENYLIGLTALTNQIVIGKTKVGTPFWLNKSEDKTQQAVNAVYGHMRNEFNMRRQDDPEIINLEFTFTDGGKLVYTPPEDKETKTNES